MASVARLAVVAVLTTIAGGTVQAQTALRLHEAIAVPQRPLLCADRDSINLVTPVLTRATDARVARDADKSKRLSEIAARLQGEVCRKAAAEDVVILRCKLAQIDTGGSALVLVKMSALIQQEAAKGEQPFYGWTDLQVDDASGPAAQEANTRWCNNERADRATRQIRIEERDPSGGPAREAEDAFTPSQDVILSIQQRLYDFGYRIENLDGQLNQETVQKLAQFQKFADLNPNGQLTRATIAKMMTMPAPSPWVAIAFDGFGNFAPEIGRTRREAEMAALERLQRRSSRDPKVASVPAPSCIGFAVTRYAERGRRSRASFTQAFTSGGDAMETAAKNAFDYCERDKGGGQCQVRYALCADGRGGSPQADNQDRDRRRGDNAPRFNRESPPINAPKPRFDPKDLSVNSRDPSTRFDPLNAPNNSVNPQPTLRFDPKGPPMNSLADPPTPPRFDPNNMPANAPNPAMR